MSGSDGTSAAQDPAPAALTREPLEAATTIEAIRWWAEARPDATAFLTLRSSVTYARLWREIELMASALLAAGVEPSAPVGHVVDSTPRHLLASLALYRLGAGALTFAANEPRRLRAPLMQRAGALICIGNAKDAIDGERHLAIDQLARPVDPPSLPPMPAPERNAYFGRSSGTSRGIPKLVETPFSLVAAMDRMVARPFPVSPDDRYMVLSPLWAHYGRFHARYTLVSGGTVVFAPAMETPDEIRASAIRLRTTTTALTGFQAQRLIKTAGGEPVFPGMRLAVGVTSLSASERRAVMERLTPRLHIGYGASEVGGITMATPEDLAVDIDTVGRPYEGIEAESVDEHGQPLPAGRVGVMRYRAAHFTTAYVDEVAGATSRFSNGWFYPGDAGSIDGAGRVTLAGRADDFLNVGGVKAHPGEIERVLGQHPAVEEVAVVGIPSERYGEQAAAAVVLRAPADAEGLAGHCAAVLGSRLRPRRLEFLDELPRTEAGKVDRAAVRRLFLT